MGEEVQTLGLGITGGEEEPQLKKQKVEEAAAEEEEEEASSGPDCSSGQEDLVLACYHSETENDRLREYMETVEKSDGFDTVELPPGDYFGVIYAMDLENAPRKLKRVRECAEYAVQEYNKGTTEPYSKLSAEQQGDLVLGDVIKANSSGCCGCNLYTTFRAENTVSRKTSVFQAMVFTRWDEKRVLLFRPQPVQCD